MITGLNIKGFKGFEHFKISQLTRTTLIGGKNNAGKTSLLEAIFLFIDRLNPQMVTNQFAWRGVNILPLEPETIWAPIFHEFEMKKQISVSVTSDGKTETMGTTFNPNYISPVVQAKKSGPEGQQLQIRTDQKPTPSYAFDISYTVNGTKGASHLLIGAEGLGLQVEIIGHKEKLKEIKKSKATEEEIDALSEIIKTTEKSAREVQAKADNIDAAVYDLKAVNPNNNAKADTRTPAEIIENIEEQGKIVAAALARLKNML